MKCSLGQVSEITNFVNFRYCKSPLFIRLTP